MRGRGGWLRIVEAVIAIMMVASVLLVAYSRTQDRPDLSDYVYDLQNRILSDIAYRADLRQEVLGYTEDGCPQNITDFVNQSLPDTFEFGVLVCNIGHSCELEISERDIYVEERIISSNLITYSPKKVRLFVWEGG